MLQLSKGVVAVQPSIGIECLINSVFVRIEIDRGVGRFALDGKL